VQTPFFDIAKVSPSETNVQLVTRRLDELRPHPSYSKCGLAVSASQLSALAAVDDRALEQPIATTRDGLIIDGYTRVGRARTLGRTTIQCIEYELTEEEALRWLLRMHRPSIGYNDYIRILLALELEPFLRKKARLNQQVGGRRKLLSKLTEAETMDVRREMAVEADVSVGNVTKVQQLHRKAPKEILQALRSGEISIHRAWLWSHEPPEKQLENLRLRRIERGIRSKSRALVAEHRAEILPSTPDRCSLTRFDLVKIAGRLSTMSPDESIVFGPIDIAFLNVPGKGIYITQELVQALKPKQEVLVKCEESNRSSNS
jgi:hypothetical protein